jgi:ATP-binding protein involved in chromosome partitioning
MSWMEQPDGTRLELFGAGGGLSTAEDLKVPLLGQVPFHPSIRIGGDNGLPVVVSDPQGSSAQVFTNIAQRVLQSLG